MGQYNLDVPRQFCDGGEDIPGEQIRLRRGKVPFIISQFDGVVFSSVSTWAHQKVNLSENETIRKASKHIKYSFSFLTRILQHFLSANKISIS